jgi:hypothetical protein
MATDRKYGSSTSESGHITYSTLLNSAANATLRPDCSTLPSSNDTIERLFRGRKRQSLEQVQAEDRVRIWHYHSMEAEMWKSRFPVRMKSGIQIALL